MDVKEIVEQWLGSAFLEQFKKKGEEIGKDILTLKRIEFLKSEIRERKIK